MTASFTLANSQVFQLPTPDQVADHLAANVPRGPSRLVSWLPMMAFFAVLVISLAFDHVIAAVLPWMALVVVLWFVSARARRVRRLERQAVEVEEMAILRYHLPTLERAWQLLPSMVGVPSVHGRMVSCIAHCLDQLQLYDSAILTYSFLIDRLPGDHDQAVRLSIERSIAQLQMDHLADADDNLRGLRGLVLSINNTVINGAYQFAQLVQHVRTNHFEDAVALAPVLVEQLRPLGVEAAYGHALMALSCHHLSDSPGTDEVDVWWHRATLLMPAVELIHRFGELRVLDGRSMPPGGQV